MAILSVAAQSSPGQPPAGGAAPRAVSVAKEEPELAVPLPSAKPSHAEGVEALAIDWPTVLRLARASNLEIEMTAEKVCEAHLLLAAARAQWLPSLQLGTRWLHHDGRIQDIPGQILDASKSSLAAGPLVQARIDPHKVCVDVLAAQQQVFARSGELDRATRQTLLEVSQAYVDLLAAQGGAAISIELADLIGRLLERSKQLFAEGVGTQVDVFRNEANHLSSRQQLMQAREKQLAASAQLVKLLNLGPQTRLYASDAILVPVRLVNENQPEAELIERAYEQGPGISEVFSMMNALEEQQRRLRRINYLPVISIDLGTGAFGGGTGSHTTDFSEYNQMGLGLHWDVLRIFAGSQAKKLFDSKRHQAMLHHQQVKANLGAAIVVSRDAALNARQRVDVAESEVDIAVRTYRLSAARLKAAETVSFEVLQAIAALGQGRKNYLTAVIDYNRAQIQLQYLIGSQDVSPPAGDPGEVEPAASASRRRELTGADPVLFSGAKFSALYLYPDPVAADATLEADLLPDGPVIDVAGGPIPSASPSGPDPATSAERPTATGASASDVSDDVSSGPPATKPPSRWSRFLRTLRPR